MRRLIVFPCAGERLTGTLDEAPGKTGLLIVSGGNEVRMGAHRGMASLAARLAASGVPVFRYDRRGIGDSTGSNGGFLELRTRHRSRRGDVFGRDADQAARRASECATPPPRSRCSTAWPGSTP